MVDAGAQLIQLSRELVTELRDFLEAHAMTEPSMEFEGSDAEWAAHSDAVVRHGTGFNDDYASRFAGRALAYKHAFAARGIEPAPDQQTSDLYIEHPTNPLGVRKVMTMFEYLATTLELRGAG